MNDFICIQCPYCGEVFEIALDFRSGRAEFVVDCEVCCRPMTVKLHLSRGEVEDIEVSAS